MVASFRVSSLAVVLLAAPPLAAQGVLRGPYLNDVTADAVTVVWETPVPSTGTVRWGAASVAENAIDVTTPATHHAIRLTGLLALTGGEGNEVRYEVTVHELGEQRSGRFSTAVDGSTPFAFAVYGDNRSNTIQHEAVIDALSTEPKPIRFIVSTGDMVSNGQNEADWDDFFTTEGPVLASLPFYSVLGNHEVDGGDWWVTERIFEHPREVPPASGSEAFYHTVYGNVELIVLNSDVNTLFRIGQIMWGAQETWLRDVLNNPPAGVEHRFVFIHQGPYSSKPGRTGNILLRTWLADFEAAGIDVIFSGHDHYAERGWTANGIPYAIHGGGGAPLYDTLGARAVPDHTIVYSQSILGYIVVEIDGPLAQIWTKGLDGEVVDYFAYGDAGAPECAVDSDCTAPPLYACAGGRFACRDHACAWTGCDTQGLDALVACVPIIADDCATQLAATCNDAKCKGIPPNTYCACDDIIGDCQVTADCAGRAPPVAGCAGTWVCVSQACEFVPDAGICDGPDPADGGPPGGDPRGGDDDPGAGGAAGTGGAAGGTGGAAGSGGAAGGTGGQGAMGGGDSDLAGGDAGGGAGGAPSDGCGCASSSPLDPVPLGLLLAGMLVRLRRRR